MAANTKTFVVDASYVLAFLLPDEHHSQVDSYFDQFKNGLIDFNSSPLLPFELLNGLLTAYRRKRLSKKELQDRLREFLDYGIEIKDVDILGILQVADKFNLTAYDASYLYLAKKGHAQLLTLDQQLQKLA